MRTLPAEFRHRVVALTDDGFTTGEIAEALGTSAAWVRSIKALHNAGRSIEPKSWANTRRPSPSARATASARRSRPSRAPPSPT